ncbi:hypothetical protein ACLHIM_02800 [Ligilactobacillus sp. LYQ112]|uniref:hypothetical protein n=1 Tax=Ligilactobacillus sp. LYQ112 TaxID=3391060 RepID=UPI0039831A84
MKTNFIKTKYGNFAVKNFSASPSSKKGIIFFSGLGVNSAIYDYFNLANNIKNECANLNIICADMLNCRLSSKSSNQNRNINQISTELNRLCNELQLEKLIIVCHSFSAIYLLNIINNPQSFISNYQINGLVTIDPTNPQFMLENSYIFNEMLSEEIKNKKLVQNGKSPDIRLDDVNPLLPDKLKKDCLSLYRSLSGNDQLIAEITNAKDSINKVVSLTVPNALPTLCFISTLNSNEYTENNPYFNKNKLSMEVKLNGHHYLHWLFPEVISRNITEFSLNLLENN